ncbi:MAG: PqqD family protein [Blastocatellia bacterium]|nr:PqqD family protein [Blastocatellia bacterium]MCX7753022.1 PqqD family protein [Blastocatellia bacterium]MDW8168545.1 PqqD family protein [Acidobacteriota bacterium]MDW8257292.1 PqqD family protein [Acidobacteriota bacterium]
MKERPKARRQDLIQQEVGEELLIYDQRRHRAFCLNPMAALVWRRANGRRTIAALSRIVERTFKVPEGESIVRLAVNRLARARLLENWQPFLNDPRSPSRREVMRQIGRWGLSAGLALLLPTVKAILAPTAAQAATCVTPADCSRRRPGQCGQFPSLCCGTPGWRCQLSILDLPNPRPICVCLPPFGP